MTEEAQQTNDAARLGKNEVILRDLHERLEAHDSSPNQRFSEWVCECADMNCLKPVELSIAEYEMVRAEPTRFVVAPGDEHVTRDIEHVVHREERYWIVEKIGVAAEVSEKLDPRS
jgi:hypothetical protein